jgi:hypothetical protein
VDNCLTSQGAAHIAFSFKTGVAHTVHVVKGDLFIGSKALGLGFVSFLPTQIRKLDRNFDTLCSNVLCHHQKMIGRCICSVLVSTEK